MSTLKKWIVPYMVMSAWLSFVCVAIGLVIHSPSGLIEVAAENKRTKEIASYVAASLHGLAFAACAIAKYRSRSDEFEMVVDSHSNVSS